MNQRTSSSATTDLALIDAWWRAANYLSVGQIYLMANPLLREPLAPSDLATRRAHLRSEDDRCDSHSQQDRD